MSMLKEEGKTELFPLNLLTSHTQLKKTEDFIHTGVLCLKKNPTYINEG